MPLVAGIDVGASAVKSAVMNVENSTENVLAMHVERIRRRDVASVIRESFDQCLEAAKVQEKDLEYIATTGEGDMVDFRTGHFFSMTTHSRGALYLMPKARGTIDLGALHTRAIRMDERGKVLQYRMSSQCASGSGQFLENIARYLGVTLAEVGTLSKQGEQPEMVSSICAVLSETDVINMVSRGISTANILQGIHLSISSRLTKLLRAVKIEKHLALSGGLAQNEGLVATLQSEINRTGSPIQVETHKDSIFAGAIGAAIWGAFRIMKMKEKE